MKMNRSGRFEVKSGLFRWFTFVIPLIIVIVLVFSVGTQMFKMGSKNIESLLSGLEVNIRTYDEESRVIDSINGNSVMISRDTRFDTSNSEGFSNNDSSVINITIGNNEISHVGSSLILAEKNMMDIFDEYKKNVNISNEEYSTPMINRVVNAYKNAIVGKSKIILVRSQNGTPLATYAGDKVSTFPTEIPKSTAFLIDDKVLIIYRCDYTVYDKALLDE